MDKIPNFGERMMRIGITGGIGSGKTSVCKVFKVLGIPVFYADNEAKLIMGNDMATKKEINHLVGHNVYSNGVLNRTLLANLMYNDKNLLVEINQLVHPLVFRNFNVWANNQDAPYVVLEAAILFESGIYELVDRVVTVIAPVEERINRVMGRNKHTREHVLNIIKNQMDDATKIKLSQYVIRNADDDMIIPEVLNIHADIIKYLKIR